LVEKPELRKEVQSELVKSFWLSLGELRFDASFYTQEVSRATRLLEESGYEILPLYDSFSKNTFYLYRQKRFFADSISGQPYLMPSELFDFPFIPSKRVYAKKLKNPDEWYVKEGWILLTRSGTLGEVTFATKSLLDFIISDDVIRIVPQTDSYSGYLYAYLCTWMGKALLAKDQYGVAVEHIEPHHVNSVKIPELSEDTQKRIHNNILAVFRLREKARALIQESQALLLDKLELPNVVCAPNTAFEVNSRDIDLRFDVSYHTPKCKQLLIKLQGGKYPLKKIGDKEISHEIFIPNRFKRAYVEKEYGIPFLSGTNIAQIKPIGIKYISKRATKNKEKYLLQEKMVLITARGTLGRVMPVTKSTEGWAASDNIARVIPNEVDFGFLTSFLHSAYGQSQIEKQTAGSIVNILQPQHISKIQVPQPPLDIQLKIGNPIIEAYELREKANMIEKITVQLLEEIIQKGTNESESSYHSTLEIVGDEDLDITQALEQERKGQLGSWEELKKETGLDEI
jgi:type I restriction enzyme S subunit